jgi:hypothetical protein
MHLTHLWGPYVVPAMTIVRKIMPPLWAIKLRAERK